MAILSYCPEMGQAKPANVNGNVRYAGKGHYMIETALTLSGRGVKFVETIKSEHLHPWGQYKAGWNKYYVTDRAMETLEKQYDFARESLLD